MNTERKGRSTVIVPIVLIAAAVLVWMLWGNTALELNVVTITSHELPQAFSGYRIAHVSDLHNAVIGKDNGKLISLLNSAEPDMIAITGDMIDSYRTDVDAAIAFVTEAVGIAPCFYVTGNHESRIPKSVYDGFERRLRAEGVSVLHDSRAQAVCGGSVVTIVGVDDPAYAGRYAAGSGAVEASERITALSGSEGFTILLSHRPELFDRYCEAEVDLVLSGHAHGGQFRLPFIGGLVAPDQGLFPKYDAGLYSGGSTNMVVSRGIGNSIIPIRFNNRPEVVLIELFSE